MNRKMKCIVMVFILISLCQVTYSKRKIKWNFKTDGKVIASPVIQNDILYVGSLDGCFYAIKAKTGKKIWEYNTENEIRTTAVIYNQEIICFESGNTLRALDLNGNLLWANTIYCGELINEHDQWDCFRSSPTLNNGVAYIGSEEGTVVGVDIESGQTVFKAQTPQANATIETTPAIYHNKIFVGDWLGVFSVFSLETGELVWQYDTKKDNTYQWWVNAIISKPLIYDEAVYFGGRNCNLYAFDPDTGEKHWMYHQPDDKWLFGGPVAYDDVLYMGSSYQKMLYAFNPESPELYWETDVNGLNYGYPVVHKDYIIVGTGGTFDVNAGSITVVNKNTQQIEGKIEVKGWVETPLLHKGIIYFGCADGNIYAVKLKKLIKKNTPEEDEKDEEDDAKVQFSENTKLLNPPQLKDKTTLTPKNEEMFSVSGIFPNPLNEEVTVTIELKNEGDLLVKLIDTQGIEVKALLNKHKTPGQHTLNFNNLNVKPGIYFFTFSMQNQSVTKRIVIN